MRTDPAALAFQALVEELSDHLPDTHALSVSDVFPLSTDDFATVVRYLGPTEAVGEALCDDADGCPVAQSGDDWQDVIVRRATADNVTDAAIGVGIALMQAMQRRACSTLVRHIEQFRALEAV